jgi:quercetin dioxygenase-like cupin family protein
MEITRSGLATGKGPDDWFTGTVFVDTVRNPDIDTAIGCAHVRFAPGARTAWHTHPFGQTIFVTEGFGLCQREGGPIEEIRPGDRVFFEAGENHWHGAAPDRFMVHLALNEVDEDHVAANWGEKVTDEEYAAASTTER